MAKLDLTGKRFDRLLVLREADQPYRSPTGKPTRRWVCKCDCGNEVIVLQNVLTAKTKHHSCGCAQRESAEAAAIDLTGQRFGRLVVVQRTKLAQPEHNGVKNGWLCKCDCGNEVVLTTKALRNTKTLSCGCLLSDTAKEKINNNVLGDVSGTRISTLSSMKPRANNRSGVRGVYWNEREQQYIAHVTIRGKCIKRRCGKDINDAIRVREGLFEEYAKPIIDKTLF